MRYTGPDNVTVTNLRTLEVLSTGCGPDKDPVQHVRGNLHHPEEPRGRGPQSLQLYSWSMHRDQVLIARIGDKSAKVITLTIPSAPQPKQVEELIPEVEEALIVRSDLSTERTLVPCR